MISRTTRATLHGNHHSLVTKLPNVSLLVKHITKDSLLCKQLGQTGLQSNLQQSVFPNFFADGTACLATGFELGRYVCAAREN